MGLSFTPLAFAATAGVAREEAGLASGMLNTSRQVGGSIALAVLATIAAERAAAVVNAFNPGHVFGLAASRAEVDRALTDGFSRVFLVAAGIALAGWLAVFIIPRLSVPAPVADPPVSPPEVDPLAAELLP
jgi:hypothetical protein